MVMATRRLSQLQKRIFRWLLADEQRTGGSTSSSHWELVRGLRGDKGNISHRLHRLEARGLIVIGCSSGGKAQYLILTTEGQKWAANLSGSYE